MIAKQGPFAAAALALALFTIPAPAQEKKRIAATLDGTTGLFRTWDAETVRRGEAGFSLGWNHYNRDPGELIFKTLPIGLSFGLHDRLEVFGSFDTLKRVEGRGIPTYRVLPGAFPVPARTPLGNSPSFHNESPFLDVPVATGAGDVRLGAKFGIFSERLGDPLAFSIAGFTKISTANSITTLNRGLGTGEVDGGFGALVSKTAGYVAKFHLNALVNFVGDPGLRGTLLADLQHEFIYRGGAQFPANGAVQFIAEVDGKTFFGSRSLGLNPKSPVDLIFGLRIFPTDWISFGGGYRASLNHVREDVGARIFPAGTSGMVAQLTLAKRTNLPPTVSCAVSNATILQGETTTVRANAVDPDGDSLTYTWDSSGGRISGSGESAVFDASGIAPGKYTVTATVFDGRHQAVCSAEITVLKRNLPPSVGCDPTSTTISPGQSATIRAVATDPNNDALTYSWNIDGQRLAADGPSINFGTAGRRPGTYSVNVTVSDGELTASCTSTVTIQNRPPSIECLTPSAEISSGGTVNLRVRATDPDGDRTAVTWSATAGTVSGDDATGTFNATGLRAGTYTITATADDGQGGRASCNMSVNVSERLVAAEGFNSRRWRVDNVAKAVLDDIALRMQSNPRLRARIIGYTDGSRSETSFRGLGRRRADSAADYLKSKGIDASRLTVEDAGAASPVADNRTEAGRKKNRRVEIELTVR